MRFLRKHCLESLQEAMLERQLRVEALREAHLEVRCVAFRAIRASADLPFLNHTSYHSGVTQGASGNDGGRTPSRVAGQVS